MTKVKHREIRGPWILWKDAIVSLAVHLFRKVLKDIKKTNLGTFPSAWISRPGAEEGSTETADQPFPPVKTEILPIVRTGTAVSWHRAFPSSRGIYNTVFSS